jgi:membrane associated rhomboid family serine protease
MPYQCRLCGGTYCSEHRLPENHDCPGLDTWGDPDGVFDSGFDDSVTQQGSSGGGGGIADAVPVDTGPGSVFAYFRGNLSFLFLTLMAVMFVVQYAIAPAFGVGQNTQLWYNLFTLNSTHPEYVWTWLTSIFAHGGFTHILFNAIVLYFFGPVVEDRVGSKKFAALFLGAGAAAGLAQVGASLLMNPGLLGEQIIIRQGGVVYANQAATAVLGASGAITALMGVLTVLNPNLRIYLYFVIPMPLWLATALFAAYSILFAGGVDIGAGGVAQVAHLAGLGIGLLYGAKLKRDGARAPKQLQFGGGGGPGGPGGGMGGPGRRR